MIKNMKKKLMPLFVTMILLLSLVIFVPQSVMAETEISSDGSIYALTPGDEITIDADGLEPDTRYNVSVWNNDTGEYIELGDAKANDDGEFSLDINVPGWSKLGQNPIGVWPLSLFNESAGAVESENFTNITIGNYYKIKVAVNGVEVDSLLFNKSYYDVAEDGDVLSFTVQNWTGTSYVDVNEKFNFTMFEPDASLKDNQTNVTKTWTRGMTFDYIAADGNRETVYWLNVTNMADGTKYSNRTIFVKPTVTVTYTPSTLDWGDDSMGITVRIKDGQATPANVPSYPCAVYAPNADGSSYDQVATGTTSTTGTVTFSINPNEWNPGTWYVGTWFDGGSDGRINETEILNINDFIQYYSFSVGSDTSAVLSVVDPDEIITGFTQTINVSVYDSWDEDYFWEMILHVTGIDCYYDDTEYDSTDVVVLDATHTGNSSNGKYAYYEFDIVFNETGTVTIKATYDLNNSAYEDTDLIPKITGQTTATVVAAGNINLIIINPPTVVEVDETADGANQWRNETNPETSIEVYGKTQDDPINATVYITGCGLDIEIEEDDADYKVSAGVYNISLSPKTGGVLTFRVVNESDELEATKDYSISGLHGTVTTSVGDDLEITVEDQETITVNVEGTSYAEVHITYYPRDWNKADADVSVVNDTIGDMTAGNGLGGEYTFLPDEDFLERVGWLVVAAKSGDYYMYDIVEITPVHDLVITVTTPDEANQTFTAGLENEIIVEVTKDGESVDDCDTVTGQILDEEGEVVQEFDFTDDGNGIWSVTDQILWFEGELLITAVNNSDANEHDGNVSLMVELATITYSPAGTTAGIGLENVTVDVTGVDANGYPLNGITLYLYWNATDAEDLDCDDEVILDEDGIGEFTINIVGDNKTTINATLGDNDPEAGNRTLGVFYINFPAFDVDPTTIYVNKANLITIIANDYEGDPLPDIWLTFYPTYGEIAAVPDPVETDSDGMAMFSINPSSSGTLNLTIIKDIDDIDNTKVTTDTYLTATYEKELTIIATSPVYKGDTVTVTIKSGTSPVADVAVTFVGTATTDADGEVTFDLSDIDIGNADSAIYEITAEKAGYITATKSITVINKFDIIIVISDEVKAGGEFTATIIAGGQPLAGATVTFEGTSKTSNGNGIVTFTAPEEGPYTITATCTGYIDGTLEFDVLPGTPGFELLTLIVAIGIAFILLRRRRKQ